MKKVTIAAAALLLAINMQAQLNAAYGNNDADNKTSRKEKREEKMNFRKEERNNEMNYQLKNQLFQDFSDISNVQWTRTDNFYEAEFTQNGEQLRAFYDMQGELVGTTSLKTFDVLPENAKKLIDKQYRDLAVENVILFDDNESNQTDMIYSGNPLGNEDNYFVELKNKERDILLRVDMSGFVHFYKDLRK